LPLPSVEAVDAAGVGVVGGGVTGGGVVGGVLAAPSMKRHIDVSEPIRITYLPIDDA
jgi:hypothetical protein